MSSRCVFVFARAISNLLNSSLVGFYLGRPFYTNMEDVTVKKPNDDVDYRAPCKWTPYASSIPFDNNSELYDCVGAVSRQEVSLCELMAPCGYFL